MTEMGTWHVPVVPVVPVSRRKAEMMEWRPQKKPDAGIYFS